MQVCPEHRAYYNTRSRDAPCSSSVENGLTVCKSHCTISCGSLRLLSTRSPTRSSHQVLSLLAVHAHASASPGHARMWPVPPPPAPRQAAAARACPRGRAARGSAAAAVLASVDAAADDRAALLVVHGVPARYREYTLTRALRARARYEYAYSYTYEYANGSRELMDIRRNWQSPQCTGVGGAESLELGPSSIRGDLCGQGRPV
jgi:hypothetical protein